MSAIPVQHQRVVSGMRPTGLLHLGHYHGVLKNWVVLQHEYQCYFFVADWHALTTSYEGPKVIVAEGECQLNRQRRVQPQQAADLDAGKRVVKEQFGIDENTCTGDHSCIRLSGCPSLSIKANPDPLRDRPIAQVDNSCVGCGVCGSIAHAAVLCPSFYRRTEVHNPNMLERTLSKLNRWLLNWALARREVKA